MAPSQVILALTYLISLHVTQAVDCRFLGL